MNRGFLLILLMALGCSGNDEDSSGTSGSSCTVVSTESADVRSCIEFKSLTEAQLQEAESSCNAAQAGVIKTWRPAQGCSSSGRIGRCIESAQGLNSTRWSYATGQTDRDETVLKDAEAQCESAGGSWSTNI